VKEAHRFLKTNLVRGQIASKFSKSGAQKGRMSSVPDKLKLSSTAPDLEKSWDANLIDQFGYISMSTGIYM
jgi:hypothetical protein